MQTGENGAAATIERASLDRLAAARAAVASKLTPIPAWSYGRIIVARPMLQQLVKLGSKSREINRRLTDMLRFATDVADYFDQQRDAFTNHYALYDSESDQMMTRETDVIIDGKMIRQTVPVMKNEPEFNLLMSELLRADVTTDSERFGTPPKPFTYAELRGDAFGKKPDPDLIAKLGPFVDIAAGRVSRATDDEDEQAGSER